MATGLHIITPSSVTATGTSASISGRHVTMTAVTDLTVNGIFSATYTNYLLVWDLGGSANGQAAICQFTTSGTPDTSANGSYQVARVSGATFTGSRTTGASGIVGFRCSNESNSNLSLLWIYQPFETAITNTRLVSMTSLDDSRLEDDTSIFNTTTSYDGIHVDNINGGGSVTGSLYVYGLAES